jgi:hypothetical protein
MPLLTMQWATRDAMLRWEEYRRLEVANFNEKSDRADCAGGLAWSDAD